MKDRPSFGYLELILRFNDTTDLINLTKCFPSHSKPGIFPICSFE